MKSSLKTVRLRSLATACLARAQGGIKQLVVDDTQQLPHVLQRLLIDPGSAEELRAIPECRWRSYSKRYFPTVQHGGADAFGGCACRSVLDSVVAYEVSGSTRVSVLLRPIIGALPLSHMEEDFLRPSHRVFLMPAAVVRGGVLASGRRDEAMRKHQAEEEA